MTRTRTWPRGTAAVLAVSMVVAACTGAGPDDDGATPTADATPTVGAGDAADTGDTPTLDGVGLASTTAGELDRVRITGLDPDVDLASISATATADGRTGRLWVFADADGPYLVTPLHPAAPGRGGDATVELTVDGASTGPLPLTLTGLPAADGAFDQLVAELRDGIAARAEGYGSDVDELLATEYGDLSESLQRLRIVAEYVDNDDDRDLAALADNQGLDEDARTLLDQVVAHLDVAALIADADAVVTATAEDDALAGRGTTAGGGRLVAALAGVRPAPPVLAAGGDACQPSDVTIDGPGELRSALATGADATIWEGSAQDQLIEDVASLDTWRVGFVVGETTIDDVQEGIPIVDQVVTSMQVVIGTLALLQQSDAGRYPTTATVVDADRSTDEFNEDFKEPGTVGTVTVVAESTGFDGAEQLGELAGELLAAATTAAINKGRATRRANNEGWQRESGRRDTWKLPDEFRVSDYLIAQNERVTELVYSEVVEAFAAGTVSWCPEQWEVEIDNGAIFIDLLGLEGLDTNDVEQAYRPNTTGPARLGVALADDVFDGILVPLEIPMEVKTLQVTTDRPIIVVDEPGDPASVDVRLVNADDRRLEWDLGPARFTDRLGAETSIDGSRPIKTPDSESDFPFVITVESLSRSGLREDAEPRAVEIGVRLAGDQLVVDPDPALVAPGGTVTFGATGPDGDPVDVTWTTTGGEIGATNGVYEAPRDEGSFTVTAASTDDPTVTGTATVVVLATDGCTFRYDVSGSVQSEAYTGPVTRTVEFVWPAGAEEPDTGTMNTRALGAGDDITRVVLNDLEPVQSVLVWNGGDPLDPVGIIPLDVTGPLMVPGAVSLSSISGPFGREFRGEFTVDVLVNTAVDDDGVRRAGLLVGAFGSLGELEVQSPLGDTTGSVAVTGGQFVFDPATCGPLR